MLTSTRHVTITFPEPPASHPGGGRPPKVFVRVIVTDPMAGRERGSVLICRKTQEHRPERYASRPVDRASGDQEKSGKTGVDG
jgi:hypothetical protein